MNKQGIRKAFIVCASIGLVYAAMAFNVQDRFSMKRTFSAAPANAPKGLNVAVSAPSAQPARTEPVIAGNSASIEPSFLIAVPVVAYAIREGYIEKDGMIVVKKAGDSSTVYLKKPLDILKDKDKDGLKSISRIIGRKTIELFLTREGIRLPDRSLETDVIGGIGFSVDRDLIVALYTRYVGDAFEPLMPYAAGGFEITKKEGLFRLDTLRQDRSASKAREGEEWTMPDLTGLSMKAALDRIASHGNRVRIHGSGIVTDQYPKARETVAGETSCVLYGRSYQK